MRIEAGRPSSATFATRSPSRVAAGPITRRTEEGVKSGFVDHSTIMREGRSQRLHTTALDALTSPLCTPHEGSGAPAATARELIPGPGKGAGGRVQETSTA